MIIAALVLVALWYAFRPEKLFINKKVDEPPPAMIMISTALVPADHPARATRVRNTSVRR
jgi:hypothetical protein